MITLNEDDQLKIKVNKHPKFDKNFDIQRLLKHFEYEMNRTQVKQRFSLEIIYQLTNKWQNPDFIYNLI